MRETARNARAGDRRNLNMARIADEIADAITDDLAQARAGPEVADAISAAVGFSRELNDRFSRGTVGKLLGRQVTGGERVPASLTLEQSIGVTGPRAREALDDIKRAFASPEAPGSEVMIGAAEDFMRSRFLQRAVARGQLDVRSARRFVQENEELLGRLPGLRSQIDEAISSGEILTLRQRQRERVRLDDPKVSKATLFIQNGPVEAFRDITQLPATQAARETQQLVNRVSHDETGVALAGLKSGFLEFLLSGARERARDIQGSRFVSGFALRDSLNEPGARAAVSRLFTPDERQRLDAVVRDFIRLERRLGAPLSAEGVIGDRPSKVLETVAGITGAGVGRVQAAPCRSPAWSLIGSATSSLPGCVIRRAAWCVMPLRTSACFASCWKLRLMRRGSWVGALPGG
jgi:hypothetical protein